MVYKINENTKYLKLVQQIVPKSTSDSPIDMELNERTQLLYVLNYEKTITVYLLNQIVSDKDKQKES